MSERDVVLCSIEDGVAVLTLNRPDRLNAWTDAMHTRYFDLLAECGAREEVRVIVVTGAGRGFCAGADMDRLQGLSGGTDTAATGDPRPQTFPLTIPKPIIAAVNGAAAGLGFVHAVMCDLRFAAAGAKLTTSFARRGLVAEYGLAWLLPRLVGTANALDLLFSARIVLAEEAASLGLVNRVVAREELLDSTLAYARDLAANCSPASLATMKGQVYGDLERGLGESYERAIELMLASFERPDFGEGVQSFLERRPPRFAPVSV